MDELKIGITGSKGVIGKLITNEIRKRGLHCSAFQGDIRDHQSVHSWLNNDKITHVIHLASKVAINEVNENKIEAFDVNVGGTIQLIKAINNLEKRIYLFFASSSHVYKSKATKIKESDKLKPHNLYGLTKSIAEKILMNNSNNNIVLCIGRIFSFYHDSQKPPFLYPSIKERLIKEDLEKPFELYGADSKRDFLNAEDVAKIILDLVLKNYEGIINIGSGKSITISEFVQSISKVKLNIVKYKNDQANFLVADIRKLKKVIDGK